MLAKIMWFSLSLVLFVIPPRVSAQISANLSRFESIGAVPGYEDSLRKQLEYELKDLSLQSDNVGNLIVTIGKGSPHRLLATAIDEPGYVVAGITSDGFLRVQRLPQAAPNSVFDKLHFAQPVRVSTTNGKWTYGVFAGLSVHLQPGRQNAPAMNDPDQMYVDIGASSADEVRGAGVDLLCPIVLDGRALGIGKQFDEIAGPAVGDRFGAAALRELAWKLSKAKTSGSTTIAFLTQSWTGGRGLNRLLEELHPDEMVYLGRIVPVNAAAPLDRSGKPHPGQGVLLAMKDVTAPIEGFAAEIQKIAAKRGVLITAVNGAPLRVTSYAKSNVFPERFVHLSVPILWPVTPVETVSTLDVGNLEQLLEAYVGISEPLTATTMGGVPGCEKIPRVLPDLVEAYGASGHEEAVRNEVKKLLPEWARNKLQTDDAGNLILHLGIAGANTNTRPAVFVAHTDEIGYQVRSIEPDGRLAVDVLGGGYSEYFLGHTVLVHKTEGEPLGGVLELPEGWDKSGFEWPRGPRTMDEPAHVYLGTRSAEETATLGIKVGDWITIPKRYHPLLGTRANARSFDDRVGCAALIEAVKALGPNLSGRDITFVWSTEEEVGLKGAAAYAERMAKEGKVPDFVFAIDTFVSSDSPLESRRFADAEIGKGFVIRAVDNSNVTPREYVERVISIAHENNIPVQYGVTGGGNDGSVFTRYGSVDIPLGWPLRYSHSPGEVIDTRDVDALAKIIAALAKNW
ncbi:MAG TPA: M20/M25/M40 family metallo-hydrolase [Candidatus Angelobacter sp.]|nr:M20/M25/M40 family metallo-hydrolase [Candidatus Angelobacter sp.]